MATIAARVVLSGSTVVCARRGVSPSVYTFRNLSSNNNPNAKHTVKKSSDYVWHAATVAACGLSFVAVRWSLQNINSTDDAEDSPETVEPQAEVTSKVFFDVAIDNNDAGRIVLGLHGGVVPKTVKNFQALCEGTQNKGNLRLSYDNTTFHRIIPNFMVSKSERRH